MVGAMVDGELDGENEGIPDGTSDGIPDANFDGAADGAIVLGMGESGRLFPVGTEVVSCSESTTQIPNKEAKKSIAVPKMSRGDHLARAGVPLVAIPFSKLLVEDESSLSVCVERDNSSSV
mmetsp:Transcript_9481/g.13872  ORF Transcript_9481/g.13872 Transcript_9481/m.13872 type:complete len:121 (+) Transcript_9481:1219-1581(+)